MGIARRPGRAANGSLGRILLLMLGLLLLAAFLSSTPARAPPPIPMTTQGTAFDRTGTPLPAGTPIRTFIDGVDYSNHSTVFNNAGAYSALTAGNLVLNRTMPEPSPTKEGANLGEPILYAASNFTTSADMFQEVLPWYPDRTVTQALHLGTAQTTPEPVKIQGLVTQPAQGGAQFIFLCNPTPSRVSLSDYYLQVDRPGTYYGGNLSLSATIAPSEIAKLNLTSPFALIPTGDALKLVYRNPGGAGASAGGRDIVVDRVEFNATSGGTLFWQPGATIMGSAPAPGPGQILERSPSCADTNSPSDFHLAREPGLPANLPPNVTIAAPMPGQGVAGGQSFTIRWTMASNVFQASYLRVWVNVTFLGNTTSLLAGTTGATSLVWSVPAIVALNAVIQVDVVDPFGAKGTASTSFNIVPAMTYSLYVAVLVVLVIVAFVILAFLHAKREKERTSLHPPPDGTSPASAPTKTAQPASVPAAPPAEGTKICPRCSTAVNEADESCFYCGYPFAPPPP